MNQHVLVIFILGFSSGLPMALITSTLQAWFASTGSSVLVTGMLSLISIPYAYRFLWSPILDRYSLFKLGKRRSWILLMQLLLLAGFNMMAWFNPEKNPQLLATLALLLAFFSATQDIAIDAHRVEYLPYKHFAFGASIAVLGYRIALLISGGLALVIAQKWGWVITYRIMGFIQGMSIFAILFSREPASTPPSNQPLTGIFGAPFKELFARPGILNLCCFIFFYKLGEAFTTTTSGIVMPFLIQGLGFSLDVIGYVNKILGVGSIILGGLTAGIFLLHYSLFRCLLLFGILQALTNVLFLCLALVGKNVVLLSTAVFLDNFAAGMGSTALVALIMQVVDKRFTGTQFSILVGLSTIPRIISGPIAASIELSIGWVGLYQLSIGLALVFIPFLFFIKNHTNDNRLLVTRPKLDFVN